MKIKLTLIFLFFTLFLTAQDKKKFKLPNALNEASGVVYNSPDSIWWINDSGNTPALFLTDLEGNMLKKIVVPKTKNRDWEDLTSDNQGNIFIGDFGNNANRRKDLMVYIFNVESQYLDSIPFSLPDQTAFPPPKAERNFDLEAFFWLNDQLHLFSKNKLGSGNYTTKHYVLDAKPKEQVATLVNNTFLKKRVVTSAAIRSDGKEVVLIAYYYKPWLGFLPITRTSVFVFSDFEESDFLSGKMKKKKVVAWIFPTQYESIDFVGNNRVIIASERTAFIRARGRIVKL